MPSPYSSIHKLPDLIKKYTEAYMNVLNGMAQPIFESIEDARKRVLQALEGKEYKSELSEKFMELYRELKNKAERCNNIATFQNIRVEADALKRKLINEIDKRDAVNENTPPYNPQTPNIADEPPELHTKLVNIKDVNYSGTWLIKSKSDVDTHIEALRKSLYNEIESGNFLNVEF
jgi:hypothetical protein